MFDLSKLVNTGLDLLSLLFPPDGILKFKESYRQKIARLNAERYENAVYFSVIPRSSWNLLHLHFSVRDQRRIISNAMNFEPFLQAGDQYFSAY